jgi:hypothetical protein
MARIPLRKLPQLSDNDIKRFWKYVNKEPGQGSSGDCWEWQAYRLKDGYAQIGVQGRSYYVHRIAYLIQYGVDPGAQLVCHTCDNRACCRGDHFFLGDDRSNLQDCFSKGRWRAPVFQRPRGIDNWKTTLTEQDVRDIRAARLAGVSGVALARKYGVYHATIYGICSRRTWKHIP